MVSVPRRAGWDDLLDVPEGYVGEIVGGHLVTHPRPGAPHAETTADLGMVLGGAFRFGRGGPGGWVILDEPRVALADDIRVPDLAGWRAERYVRPTAGPFEVVPDWICEVLSRRTEASDRTEKRALYARVGVRHLWLVDPVVCTLEAFELRDGEYVLVLSASGVAIVRVPPFDAIELELALLWGDRLAAAALGE